MNKEYYQRLIGRLYKILPMFEQNQNDAYKYCKDLCLELSSDEEPFEIIIVRKKLCGVMEYDWNKYMVRKTIFDNINIVKKMLTKLGVDNFANK